MLSAEIGLMDTWEKETFSTGVGRAQFAFENNVRLAVV